MSTAGLIYTLKTSYCAIVTGYIFVVLCVKPMGGWWSGFPYCCMKCISVCCVGTGPTPAQQEEGLWTSVTDVQYRISGIHWQGTYHMLIESIAELRVHNYKDNNCKYCTYKYIVYHMLIELVDNNYKYCTYKYIVLSYSSCCHFPV